MTNRELSEKLCSLACRLSDLAENGTGSESKRVLILIADELHSLSNEKYTPNASWDAVKKQTEHKQIKKKGYKDSRGRDLPF